MLRNISTNFFKLGNLNKNINNYFIPKNFYTNNLSKISQQVAFNFITTAKRNSNNHQIIQNKVFNNFSTSKIMELLDQLKDVKEKHGQDSMEMMQILHKLSFKYAQNHQYQQAIKTYKQIISTFKKNVDDPLSPLVGDTLKNLQTLYKKTHNMLQIIPLTLQIINIRIKQHGGQNHKIVANQYNQLGVAYYYIQNFQQSSNNYKKALQIRKNLFGQDSIEYTQTQNNIGSLYYSQGKTKQAKQIFSKTIQKLKKMKNFNKSMLITPLGNLAMIYDQEQNFGQALKKYKQIEEIFLENKQKDSPFLANIYHSVGNLYLKIGDVKNAQENHKKSLQINQKAYTQNHPNVAGNYHNLGLCYQYKGQYEQALKNYQKSIQIKQKTLGQKHISIAQTLVNIGIINKNVRNYQQSRKNFESSIQIIKKVNQNSQKHPAVGDIIMNVGITYLEQNNAQKSSQYLNKAQTILKQFYNESHPKIAQLIFNLAKLEFLLKRDYPKARELLDKCIKNYQITFPNHPTLYLMYSMKASCYFEQKNFNQSIKNYQNSLNILTKSGKGSHEQLAANTGLLQYQLGASYCQLKEFKKAEQSLRIALEIFESKFNQSYDNLVEIYFLMGNTKKALGQKQQAKKYLQKASNTMDILLKDIPNHPILLKKQEQIKKCMIF